MTFNTVRNSIKDGREAPAGEALVVEKKSKFYSSVWSVNSEEDVNKIIAAEKKRFPDARHYCYSYVIGKAREKVRAADDGEPQGTAGRPILEVIDGNGLIDTFIIVTRIFGGVLLGTGGLTRAYSQAAKEAVENAIIFRMEAGKQFKVTVGYNLSEKIKYFIEQNNLEIVDTAYAGEVVFTVNVAMDRAEWFVKSMSEMSASRAVVEELCELDIAVSDE
ncbi:MAG: YigZ family protein [Lachnospiraceae bacterium]|nr:YigZ family protein [Lachnospiraceae bacterium]